MSATSNLPKLKPALPQGDLDKREPSQTVKKQTKKKTGVECSSLLLIRDQQPTLSRVCYTLLAMHSSPTPLIQVIASHRYDHLAQQSSLSSHAESGLEYFHFTSLS